MSLPPSLHLQKEQKGQGCKLKKSLYGLKQASRQWNHKFTTALLDNGFQQSLHDYSLFTKCKGNSFVVLLVYVDDVLITGNNKTAIDDEKFYLNSKFKIKDLGKLRFFLGMEISRSIRGIILNQRKYALEILSEASLTGTRPIDTPYEQHCKLTSIKLDKISGDNQQDFLLSDTFCYQRLVGRLIYLCMTRPDISYSVQILSQHMHSPKKSHMDAAIRVLRYIKK